MNSAADPLTCIWTTPDAHVGLLVLVGELDYATVDEFLLVVTARLETTPALSELRIDCAKVTFCDSLGLSALLTVRRRSDDVGVALLLENRTPTLNRMLSVTGTLFHLTGETDPEDLPAALRPDRDRAGGRRPGLAG